MPRTRNVAALSFALTLSAGFLVPHADARQAGERMVRTTVDRTKDGTLTKRFYREMDNGTFVETVIVRRPDGTYKKSYARGRVRGGGPASQVPPPGPSRRG